MRVKAIAIAAIGTACCVSLACQGRLERSSASGVGEPAVAEPTVEDELDATEPAYGSETDRTAAMEELAVEAQESFDQALADATTDEERIRAYEEFERQRLELNEMAESETSDDGDAFGPPPAP